jgi:hypothetical protein
MTTQKYKIIIWKFNIILHEKVYQLSYDNIDSFTKGLYQGFLLSGQEPTGYEYLNNPDSNILINK